MHSGLLSRLLLNTVGKQTVTAMEGEEEKCKELQEDEYTVIEVSVIGCPKRRAVQD
jgi:hypothetical protein